jgi:hypothetical protein
MRHLVATYSHFDELTPARIVRRATSSWSFQRAAEPEISYTFDGERGCKPHPAIAPAESNWSMDEAAESVSFSGVPLAAHNSARIGVGRRADSRKWS